MSGGGYLVSWCVGHLVELAEPEAYDPALKKWSLDTLPIVPSTYKTEVFPGTAKQFSILKDLMAREDVTELVEATDAAREGELIFRLVYEAAGCQKPFRRLGVSSQEDAAIRAGLEQAKPSADYDSLYAAALCRQRADWLLGINLTRLYTKLYDRRLPVGRVQTPTVALIVQRQAEIDRFVPETYFTLRADLGGFLAYARADSKARADKMVSHSSGADAYVTRVERHEQTEQPPTLYDLTSLQKDANRLNGYTAKQTLDYLQRLYEAKLATYPRTDSHYLTADMEASTSSLLDAVLATGILAPALADQYDRQRVSLARVIDDAKVSDHHAILPTKGLTKATFDMLPTGEKNIISLVLYRLLEAPYAPHTYESTKLTFDLAGDPYTATGRTERDPGFRVVRTLAGGTVEDAGQDIDEPDNDLLPALDEGDTRPVLSVAAVAKKTRPPMPYTEAALLTAMETCGKTLANDELRAVMKGHGIGTTATRAAIIESIISSGYVRREKKALVPTSAGTLFMELVTDKLKDPALTAEWETRLAEIQAGARSAEDFMAGVVSFIRSFVDDVKLLHPGTEMDVFQAAREVLGTCPICGKAVVEYPKSYSCESGRDGCGFTIWKTICRKSISTAQAKKLFEHGQSDLMKGFISPKTGGPFDAYLVLKEDKSVGFRFPAKKKKGGIKHAH